MATDVVIQRKEKWQENGALTSLTTPCFQERRYCHLFSFSSGEMKSLGVEKGLCHSQIEFYTSSI